MKEQFLRMLQGIVNADITTTPRFIFIKHFYGKLVEYFADSVAAIIAGTVEVDVDTSFVEDKELMDETVKSYVAIVVNIKKACDSIHPDLFLEVVRSGANPIQVKYRAGG